MENRNNHDAIHRFEEMINHGNNYFFDLQDYLDILDTYTYEGNFLMAHKVVDVALEQYKNNSAILLFKAEILALQGKPEEAQQVIDIIKEIDPGETELPVLQADIYSRMDEHHLAIKSLQEAIKINGQDPEIYDLITIEYLYLDDFNNALKMSLESLSLEPNNQSALYNAITCYDLMGKEEKAVKFLKKYVNEQPLNEIGWSLLGKKYIELKQFDKALEALDFSIAIDDKFLGAYFDKAYVLTKTKQYEKAIEFYKLTLAISSPSAFTYYHIAKNYKLLNNYKKAELFYEKAVHQDPGHYKSWLKLIDILIEKGDTKKAMQKSLEATQTIPNQELYEQLAKIYLTANNEQKAIDILEKSIPLGIMKISTAILLSDLYKKQKNIEKYREILLAASKLYPESKEIKNRMTGKI